MTYCNDSYRCRHSHTHLCDDFNRRWENTTNLIKQLKNSQVCFVTAEMAKENSKP